MSDEKPNYDRRESDAALRKVQDDLRKVKDDITDITRAFPKNEYDEPDYDGHRNDHKVRMAAAAKASEDKRNAVNSVRNWLLIGICSIVMAALLNYAKELLTR